MSTPKVTAAIINAFRLRHHDADSSDIQIEGNTLDWYDPERDSEAPRTFTIITHMGTASPVYEFEEH